MASSKPLENPSDHSCRYCALKNIRFQAQPQLKFRPNTLRLQSLLRIGYMTFNRAENALENLPLPSELRSELKQMHEELERWDTLMNSQCAWFSKRMPCRRSDLTYLGRFLGEIQDTMPRWTGYRCFLGDLHWSQNGQLTVDTQASARMILQCNLGFDRRNEFVLAAHNCLEDECVRIWPLLDANTRIRWTSPHGGDHLLNPVFSYWVNRCINRPDKMDLALGRMSSSWQRGQVENFWLLEYFWPLVVQSKGGITSDETKRMFDHAFHKSIEYSNKKMTLFIWRQAPPEFYKSMVSSERCCGYKNDHYAFKRAVESGNFDVVLLMWSHTTLEQHNLMLLAEDSKAFCNAAKHGFVDIVKLLWRGTTNNQRFVLLFAQNCAAFRQSCASGHVDVVRVLWADATEEHRRQILTICQMDSIASAARNSRLNVIKYLWENMGEKLKLHFMDICEDIAMLSKCITEAATGLLKSTVPFPHLIVPKRDDGESVLRYLFDASEDGQESMALPPTKSQMYRALMYSDATALMALLYRGEKLDKWAEIIDLLKIFNQHQREQLRRKMTLDQARKCGFMMDEVMESNSNVVASIEDMHPTPAVGNGSLDCIPKYGTVVGTQMD